MKCKFLLSIVSFLCLSLSLNACATTADKSSAADKFQYSLDAKHGVDLSVFTRGPLKLDTFSDQRESLTGKQLCDQPCDTTHINTAVNELVRDAIAQGFAQGGATLVEEKPTQILSGEVTEFQSEAIEKNGASEIQVTVRTKVQLKAANGGKTYWQGSAFGRASVPASEGVNSAIQQALDKFVVGLFNDDYFLIQLIE